ncbi:MAG: ABC transporter permease [Acidobacteria bacterium]|nr:ABC transporter permease [Acidobacteriota bacterium]
MTDRPAASHPLIQLTLVRLREFVREPEAVFWVVVFPIVLAATLGIAFRTQGDEPVHAGVLGGPGSEVVVSALKASDGIDVTTVTRERADLALRDGEVQVVVIPGTPPSYRFDPTRPESRLARLAVDAALQRAAGRADRFTAGEQKLEVVGARYVDWLVPGLLGMNIMGTGMWGIGFSIVYARNRKLLKRLAATPMARSHYLLAQMLARLVSLVAEVAALIGFAWLVFSVPVRGSLMGLATVSVAGAVAFAGLGLLVASRVRTIEAVSGLLNFVMLPMWVLSGVFFSSAHFPAASQPLIHLLPLTALNDALRAVMLDGAPLAGVSGELLILSAWALVSFGLALRLFRWR